MTDRITDEEMERLLHTTFTTEAGVSGVVRDCKRAIRQLQADVAELRAENERIGDLFDDLCYIPGRRARRVWLDIKLRLTRGEAK